MCCNMCYEYEVENHFIVFIYLHGVIITLKIIIERRI